MKFSARHWIAFLMLGGVTFSSLADSETDDRLLIRYADIFGWLSVLVESSEGVDGRCQTSHFKAILRNEVDYLFRTKTGFNYQDWAAEVYDSTAHRQTVEQTVNTIIDSIGGCQAAELSSISSIAGEKIQALLLELSLLDELNYFQIEPIAEKDLRNKLNEKLADFDNLPLEEAEEILHAIESGQYRYALHQPIVNIQIDKMIVTQLRNHLSSRI